MAQYEMRRDKEIVMVEQGEGALFYLVGTGVGVTLDAWLEQGWSLHRDSSFGLTAGAIQHIQAGRPIAAIKQVREDMGIGLGEAKQLVDDYRRKHNL